MNQVRTGYPYEVGAADPFRMPPPHVPECPLCSGKVSRDDPAAQALDWAVRMAEAKEGESDFWKVAQVAETYRRSGQADRGEISAFVEGVGARGAMCHEAQDSTSGEWAARPFDLRLDDEVPLGHDDGDTRSGGDVGSAQGVPLGGSSGVQLFWTRPPPIKIGVKASPEGEASATTLQPMNLVPPLGEEGIGRTCCPPEPFYYHAARQPPQKDAERGETRIHWNLFSSIRFSDNDPCLCKCCVFRQFVMHGAASLGGGRPETVDNIEDCRCYALAGYDEKGRTHLVRVPCSSPQVVDVVCFGEEPPDPDLENDPSKPTPGAWEESGPCRFGHHDEPGITVPWGSAYSVDLLLAGVIFNRCPGPPVVETKYIHMKSSGTVTDTGEVEEDEATKGRRPKTWSHRPK